MKPRQVAGSGTRPAPAGWVASVLAWFFVLVMLVLLAWVAIQRAGLMDAVFPSAQAKAADPVKMPIQNALAVALPFFNPDENQSDITRQALFHTIIPDKHDPITYYKVESGDSITSISKEFHIKAETIFFANSQLYDSTDSLTIGMTLKIPPIDGVLYQWKKSDTLDKVSYIYRVKPDDIITWPDNHIDISSPQVMAGALIMIPGGTRNLVYRAPVGTIWRAHAGATKDINAQCDTSQGTAVGSGHFGWPADNHNLSGNDFGPGHLGIDIGAAMGAPVYAADSGVVVFAGWNSDGYGNLIMIDHGNGFHTLYGHNSQLLVSCGQNVGKGQVISYAGSTGNSTGAHLHFEIRYNDVFVNPWDYLR